MNTQKRTVYERLNDMKYLPSEILWCEREIKHWEEQNKEYEGGCFDEIIAVRKERMRKSETELQWCVDLIASTEPEDPVLYRILCLRYIEGLTWAKTALHMPIKCTDEACKQRVCRWIGTLKAN